MTYSVACPTLDSAGSYVMQGAPFIQGTIPSIPVGGSISPEGFLLPVLLLVVIIVTVVVVIVILIVVVDDVSLILKLSFVIIGVPVGPVFLLGLLALAIVAAYAFRAEEMPSIINCWMAAKVMAGVSDVDVLLGDGDNDANDGDDDEREISWYYETISSSGTKKYRGSNSSDGGNTGDGVKIAGGVIGSGDGIEFFEEFKELYPMKWR
ncbi:hypothetical protein Tco_1028643 [Tanacetum coccineum]|uniref:Uncharacterized protein n=1 Tax=Tanacetum coccineum TaxID=301880 RepID=A0ABQ5G2Z6_9ASTR